MYEKLVQILSATLVGVLAYLSPMGEVFWCMFLFVFADLLTGIYASRKNHIATSSRRMRKSIAKLLCYLLAILLSFVAERSFGAEFGSYKLIGGFVCLVEFLSILENLTTITGNPIFLKIIELIRGTKGNVIKEILSEKNGKE